MFVYQPFSENLNQLNYLKAAKKLLNSKKQWLQLCDNLKNHPSKSGENETMFFTKKPNNIFLTD